MSCVLDSILASCYHNNFTQLGLIFSSSLCSNSKSYACDLHDLEPANFCCIVVPSINGTDLTQFHSAIIDANRDSVVSLLLHCM